MLRRSKQGRVDTCENQSGREKKLEQVVYLVLSELRLIFESTCGLLIPEEILAYDLSRLLDF